jgi:ABC-type lipoprotein export system ATPase subunit
LKSQNIFLTDTAFSMRILRLYIQGCGVFKSNLIDFTHNDEPQNLICLAGVNGSGKTTVMELIFSLLSFLNSSFAENIDFDRLKSHVLTRTEFAQLDILIDKQPLSLVWGELEQRVDSSANYIIVEPQLGRYISFAERDFIKNDEKMFSRLKLSSGDLGRLLIKPHIPKIIQEELKSRSTGVRYLSTSIKPYLDKIASHGQHNSDKTDLFTLPCIYFFNAHDREIHDIHYDSIPQDAKKYQLTHKYQPREDDIKKTLIYYDYAYPTEFEKLKSWINEYVLVDKSIEGIDRPNFEVIVRTQNGTTHGLELLSSGEESLLIVAIQCFLRASKNAVFMIDEVDQSLHPEFQEKMMMLLTQLQKDTDCQIIVSSHSEIIWRMFDSQGLIDLTSVVMT